MGNDGDDGYHRPKNGILQAAQFAKLEQVSSDGDCDAAQRSGELQKPPIKHLECSLVAANVGHQQRVKLIHHERFIGVADEVEINRIPEEAVAEPGVYGVHGNHYHDANDVRLLHQVRKRPQVKINRAKSNQNSKTCVEAGDEP